MFPSVEEILEARDALLSYATRLYGSCGDLDLLWELCDANEDRLRRCAMGASWDLCDANEERRKECPLETSWDECAIRAESLVATSWPVFEFYTQPVERTQRLISFSEYEKAAHAVLELLDGYCDRAERSAARERLKTVLELANADAGIATPTITMRRIIRDDPRRTTGTEDIEEKGTTTFLHTVLAALDSWHRRNYLLKLGLWPSTKTESERIRAVHGFFKHIDASWKVIRFEDNVRSECARAVSYLNRTENQRMAQPDGGLLNGEGSADSKERDDVTEVFIQRGNGFLVRFEGEEFVLPDTKGVRIIRKLILNQGHPVHTWELDERRSPYDEISESDALKEMSGDSRDGPERTDKKKRETVEKDALIDEDAIRDSLRELTDLRSELKREGLSEVEKNETQERIDHIEGYLGKYTDNRGQPRKERTSRNHAANRVRVSIGEFKKSKRGQMPRFIAHLDSAISTRDVFVYRPSTEVRWET